MGGRGKVPTVHLIAAAAARRAVSDTKARRPLEAVAAAAAAAVVAAAVAAAAAAGTPTLIPCCPLLYSFLSEAVRRAYGEALLSTAKDRYALAVLHVALSAGGTTRCVTRVAAIAEVAAARCDARRTATIRLPAAAVYGGSA